MSFRSLLNKVLRRAELNVAVAGAMVGSVSAMSKLFPVMEGYSELGVRFYNGGVSYWTCAPVAREECPWRDFLKWYHGRPQSESYVMRYKDGCAMFNRKDVRSYSIHWAERVKEHSPQSQGIK